MACKCLESIEKKLMDDQSFKQKFKKPVEKVNLEPTSFLLGDLNVRYQTNSIIKVTLTGQKKKPEINMKHNFCPFCGKKYEEEQQ